MSFFSVKDRRRFCCRYGGDCLVQKGSKSLKFSKIQKNLDQRNACRACRLKKCLDVGMNPNCKEKLYQILIHTNFVAVQNERGRKSTKAKERQALLLSQLPCCSNSLKRNKRSSETQVNSSHKLSII